MLSRLLLTATLTATSVFAHAASPVVPLEPNFKLDGKTAADFGDAWWMWAQSNPEDNDPVRDRSGSLCHVGQQGTVWFLAGGFGSSKIKRRCALAAGKHVFFPVVNMAYWPRSENNGYTCDQAKKNSAVNNDSALDLFVEVNGVPVKDVKRFRARSAQCFDIYQRIPADEKPYNAFPSASDGYWIMLPPLPKGTHTLKFGGRYKTDSAGGRMVQDIEYELVVQ